MAGTILLLEDEAAAAAQVMRALADEAYTIWHAETASDARAVLRQHRPDLIILDLTLPDMDGLVFCATVNNDAADVPFMVCSTGTTAEKVLAFKLGAEDFVCKPFEAVELQARVESILRRRARWTATVSSGTADCAPVATGDGSVNGRLRVDLARWRISVDDKPLDLTPTEFQLLVFLAHRPGEIISRKELARGVWGDESMSSSRTIDAYVRRISHKLSESRSQSARVASPRILNVRGLGYQLAAPQVSAA